MAQQEKEIIADILNSGGWIAGSYCRERLIRQDPESRVGDIDVLISIQKVGQLKDLLMKKYGAQEDCYFSDPDPGMGVYEASFAIDEVKVDIHASETYRFLYPPDVDVNTLCWDGEKFRSWMNEPRFSDDNNEVVYSDIDIIKIIERAKNKQVVGLYQYWDNPSYKSYNPDFKN